MVRVDVEAVATQEADQRDAKRSAASTARSDGAETAARIGTPATAAFWTISKLDPSGHQHDPIVERQRSGQHCAADQLVERVVAADVLAEHDQGAGRVEQSGRVEPAGRLEHGWASRRRPAEARIRRRDDGAGRDRVDRTSTSSSDALPQMPHEAVATKWRSATRDASNARPRWTVTSSSGWAWVDGSPRVIETIASASSISPSVRRNPVASSSSCPGCAS